MLRLKNNNPSGDLRNRFLKSALFYSVVAAVMLFLFVSLWRNLLSNPTVTSWESSSFPVSAVPYPGISLCNINKISRKRAIKMADYMLSSKSGKDKALILEWMKFIGFLYDSNYDTNFKNDIEQFQDVLDSIGFSIKDLIKSLVTPCGELLRMCHWKGVRVSCDEIFEMRLTFEGYCCTFNYAKNTSEWWIDQLRSKQPKKELIPEIGLHGQKSGLSVLVRNDPDDYFYTSLSSSGINVHVFIPTDYPDKSSGDLFKSIANIGSENFFEVIPTTVTAVKDVMNYPVEKRDCLFEVEQQTQFGVYSQSDCFVDCRVRSMKTLCGCTPFAIPLSNNDTVCELADLPCLHKYQIKWLALQPQKMAYSGIKEQEDALACPQTCYPSCEATLYEVSTSSLPISDKAWENYTQIHIYYRNRFHNLFQQDVVHYWFEILSNYGGIVGIVVGLSIVSLVEGLVFVIKFFGG